MCRAAEIYDFFKIKIPPFSRKPYRTYRNEFFPSEGLSQLAGGRC